MTQYQQLLLGMLLVTAIGLPGCVTINIYFPAAAAESAADKVIDEVWQLQPTPSGARPAPTNSEGP